MKRVILVILFLALLAGCGPSPTETTTPTITDSPSPTMAEPETGMVVRIIDGDTIRVLIEDETFTVRYIGIDAFELDDNNKLWQEYAVKATEKNEALIHGKTVRLEKDISDTDQYGRLLRYVYIGDTFVNAKLVELGLAIASPYPPDTKYAEYFYDLQSQALHHLRGIWAMSNYSADQFHYRLTETPKRETIIIIP